MSTLSSSLTTDVEHSGSGVAWAPVFGGALTAIGFTIILSPLGSAFGFGLAWPHGGEAGKALTVASAIWLIVVQWIASGLGGYLTGRLRLKWSKAHTHEVFFRDTAHGFLSWALATILGLLLLVSVFAPITHGAAHGAAMKGENIGSYSADRLFRAPTASNPASVQERAEGGRILTAEAAQEGATSPEDRAYLVDLVAARTGVSADEAAHRVDTAIANERAHMEKAHKNMAEAALFLSFSLLAGAFIASAAAALGGRDRDIHYTTGRFYS